MKTVRTLRHRGRKRAEAIRWTSLWTSLRAACAPFCHGDIPDRDEPVPLLFRPSKYCKQQRLSDGRLLILRGARRIS